LPIVGGDLATTCEWPTAIMLVGPAGCSGALVHPHVVVTAKHCLVNDSGNLTTPTSIGLGETRGQWAKTVAVSSCTTHPSNDFGICILAEDVTDIPIVPVMALCEMSELAAGESVVEVGFGWTSATNQTYGAKKWINGTIVADPPPSFARNPVAVYATTGSQDGEYYGDSGGPLFFQMPDGTWRLIGEDWGSPSIVADSTAPRVSVYTSVPYHVAWAEQVSGVDLTPCHDAAGWNPTAACTGFPTNPGAGVGEWATLCQGESMLLQPTCQGAPSDAGTQHADAGAEAGGRDGPNDGLVDASSRDSDTGDREADVNRDSDTGWAYGGEDAADARDSRQIGYATDGSEVGANAPDQASDGSAGSGGSAGAGGGNADGSGGQSDGSAGAGGSSTAQSARDDASLEAPDEGETSDSDVPCASADGGDASASADGADASASVGSDSGGDAGLHLSAASDGGGSTVGGGVVHRVTRHFGIGCACRSVSDRDAGSWPGFGLLGVVLTATRLFRRRARFRARFVV
jgi:hypothetical protein